MLAYYEHLIQNPPQTPPTSAVAPAAVTPESVTPDFSDEVLDSIAGEGGPAASEGGEEEAAMDEDENSEGSAASVALGDSSEF